MPVDEYVIEQPAERGPGRGRSATQGVGQTASPDPGAR
jgi:hypothetical protein